MTALQTLDWAANIALVLLGLALLLGIVRIAIGPTLADRVLALDLLTIIAMGFVGAIAVKTGLSLYLDLALALALVGFLATLALVRYMLSRLKALGEAPDD
jgi:multicomponent Na+:H+ antiporter subunit F